MKKVLIVLVLVFTSAFAANAQFGIVGGFTASKTGVDKSLAENAKFVSMYHAGIAYKFEIGSFFAIQPALTFQMKGANIDAIKDVNTAFTSLNAKSGFLELNLGLQLGPDLLVVRPYALLEPFIGYQVYDPDKESLSIAKSWDEAKNKFEVGFGVGAGVEIFDHVQLSVQWFMNFGKLYNGDKIKNVQELVGVKNFQGIKVTAGIFF